MGKHFISEYIMSKAIIVLVYTKRRNKNMETGISNKLSSMPRIVTEMVVNTIEYNWWRTSKIQRR